MTTLGTLGHQINSINLTLACVRLMNAYAFETVWK